jgi:hypothetical protein
MNAPNPLAQLRDIHLPEPISAWPPAPGWWFIALLSLVAFVLLIRWALRYQQRTAFRKQALSELQHLDNVYFDKPNQYLQQLNTLLKRTALHCHPKANVAALNGAQWLEFLDHSGNTTEFSQGAGQILMRGPYQPKPVSENLQALSELVKQWLQRQQRSC